MRRGGWDLIDLIPQAASRGSHWFLQNSSASFSLSVLVNARAACLSDHNTCWLKSMLFSSENCIHSHYQNVMIIRWPLVICKSRLPRSNMPNEHNRKTDEMKSVDAVIWSSGKDEARFCDIGVIPYFNPLVSHLLLHRKHAYGIDTEVRWQILWWRMSRCSIIIRWLRLSKS